MKKHLILKFDRDSPMCWTVAVCEGDTLRRLETFLEIDGAFCFMLLPCYKKYSLFYVDQEDYLTTFRLVQ